MELQLQSTLGVTHLQPPRLPISCRDRFPFRSVCAFSTAPRTLVAL